MICLAKSQVLAAIAVGGTMLGLAGCSALDYTLAKTDHQDCQWLRLFALEPACHEFVQSEPAPAIADSERYCYRSLGDVDCQVDPDEHRTPLGSG